MSQTIDIFLSYKREEHAFAETLAHALIKAGYVAVYDVNIAKNDEFSDAIDSMIRTARLTIVLWTEASATSTWVRKEARLALSLEESEKHHNKLLGVMLEDVSLSLPVDLRGLQMVDRASDGLTEDRIAAIIAEVETVIGRPAADVAKEAEAESAIASAEFQLFEYAVMLDVAAGYKHYLTSYPEGRFVAVAQREYDQAIEAAEKEEQRAEEARRATLSDVEAKHQQTKSRLRRNSRGAIGALFALLIGICIFAYFQWVNFESTQTAKYQDLQGQLSELEAAKTKAEEEAKAEREAKAAVEAKLADENTRLTHLRDTAVDEAAKQKEQSSQQISALNEQIIFIKQTALGALDEQIALLSQAKATALKRFSEDTPNIFNTPSLMQLRLNEEIAYLNAMIERLEREKQFFQTVKPSEPDCETPDGKAGFQVLPDAQYCIATDAQSLDLKLTNLTSLDALRGLRNLSELSLAFTEVSDLKPMKDLTGLTELVLTYTEVADLEPLRSIKSLTMLDIVGTDVSDLAPLLDLPVLVTFVTPKGDVHRGRDAVVKAIEDYKP